MDAETTQRTAIAFHIRSRQTHHAAEVVFASSEDASNVLGLWEKDFAKDHNPVRRDCVEYAQLAHHKYSFYYRRGGCARDLPEVRELIQDNPLGEVCILLFLQCADFPDKNPLGFALLRRTWAGNIYLDYLATHPLIARPNSHDIPLSGVGTNLLVSAFQIASSLQSKFVFIETTNMSQEYYKKVLELDESVDLVVVSRDRFEMFLQKAFEAQTSLGK